MFKQKTEPGAAAIKVEPADAAAQARTRARHRLIGAAVLLLVAILGFPLVFETQPRPIPVDIPIEIPRRENAPPLVMPPAAQTQPVRAAAPSAVPSTAIVAATPAASIAEPKKPRTPEAGATASLPARSVARTADAVVVESAADAGREVLAPKPASANDGARAQAILEGRAASPPASDGGRFVVQVGAFADADAARETRRKMEKLGLKTYTQVAQTPSGSRIRVRLGPFASRAEADAALAKARAAGFSPVVQAL